MKQIALALFSFLCLNLNAQTLMLRSGEFVPPANVQSIKDFSDWNTVRFQNKNICFLQFSQVVSIAERNDISRKTGIVFYDYYPTWTYLAAIPKNLDIAALSAYKVRSVLPFEANYKLHPKLVERPLPDWIIRPNNQVEVLVDFLSTISREQASRLFTNAGVSVTKWKNKNQAQILVNEADLSTFAANPWIQYIQAISAPAFPENLVERTNHRVNTIDQSYVTGLHYDGTGVSVAIGDDGIIGPHIDFAGRLFHHTATDNGTHGDHVTGIVGGGGNFDPVTSGNARGADLHIYSDYDNLLSAPTAYNTDGVRVTSNSLGQGCNDGYNSDARDADILINSKPSLLSVHSAGNSGNTTCGGVANGFYTITGGYKAGKNVIAVGNVLSNDQIAPSSSKGPAEDGRIKPEVVAVGTNVYSTQPDNAYDTFTGTSMSCPGVSGTLASLIQAYRATHAGADPASDLLKAVLMNTADDLGNDGPDYTYGFGRINARRAFKALASGQFFIDSMSNGGYKDFFITVPPNTRQVKVMLYWNDVEGNPASTAPLVNNLNLSFQEPTGNVLDPWVLSTVHNAAALNAPATRGADDINNVEQVTLDSVLAGPAVVSVYGANIPVGVQKYVLTFEFLADDVVLTYPQGGESFVNGVKERIRWDAHGDVDPFTLEYSSNGGATWTTISSTIAGNRRYFDWTPPAALHTGQMKMRISRGVYSDESDSLFTVFEVPKNLTVDTACGNIFHLKWDALPFATSYKIYTMGAKYMTQIGTSNTNSFVISTGVNTTDTFYFAVSGVETPSGANGLRSLAYVKLPGNVNCVDNAYNVETILPFSEIYNCAVTGPVPVKVKIKNIGLRPLVNLPVYYQVNATPVVSEIMPGPLAVGDSTIYTFTTLASLPAPTTYTITTWSSVYTDIVTINDTSSTTASILIPTTLTAPTVEDFEGPVFPPTGWRVIDADNSVKWQKTLVIADPTGFNSHAAYMDFFNYTSFNQIDDLETAQYDLNGITSDSVIMTFDLSHAYGVKGIDSLSLLVSEDCGLNWTQTTYYKGGIPLATAGSMGTIFSPTLSTQWRNDRLDLTSYIGKKIFVRFRGTNMNGNNLFVDNINIQLKDAWPLGLPGMGAENLNVYPNPSDGNYVLEFNSSESKEVRYRVFNITGQRIRESRVNLTSGKTKVALNLSNMPSGIYMLELMDGQKSQKIKLVRN